MGFSPAVGTEVHADAGGEQGEADGEGSDDPGELDAAFLQEVVEDAEDQDEDGGLCEEGGGAPAGEDDELGQMGLAGGWGVGLDEADANGVGLIYCRFVAGLVFVKHKTPLCSTFSLRFGGDKVE